MELHRLDGFDATAIQETDTLNDQLYNDFGALGELEEPEIAYELLDENGDVLMYADLDENVYVIDGLNGFFRKIGRGLKKFGKKVVKPIVKTFNRFLNPATILLRNGFLLAMKLNMFKVASRLRWGYLSEAAAKKRGGNMRKFAKLRKIVRKAEKIFSMAGGRTRNLKKAILKGKGNKDRAVPLSGTELGNIDDGPLLYNDPFEKFVIESDPEVVEAFVNGELEVNGLNGIATGSAIAAASSAVAGVAALLSGVGKVFDGVKSVKKKANDAFRKNNRPRPAAIAPVRRTVPTTFRRPTVPRPFRTNRTSSIANRSRTPIIRQNKPIVTAKNSTTTNPNDKSFFQRYKTPLILGGLSVAAAGVYYALQSNTKKKSKPVSGVPKKRKTTKGRDTLGRFTKGHSVSRKKRKTTKTQPKRLVPKALL